MHVCMCGQSLSRVQPFASPWTVACRVFLAMWFSWQEYWLGFPFPPPGDLPNPGIEPTSPVIPALTGGYFPLSHLGSNICKAPIYTTGHIVRSEVYMALWNEGNTLPLNFEESKRGLRSIFIHSKISTLLGN